MKRTFFLLAFVIGFSTVAAHSQVVIRVGPPRVIVERPLPPPGPHHVWVPGYYRWGGTRYIWVPGTYALPPRPGAIWIAPQWVSRNGAWVFVRGYWR